ncbi:hypothetical protein EVA_21227, partial [gut metagenome]
SIVMSFMTLVSFAICAEATQGPFLMKFLFLNVMLTLLVALLGYLLYHNVLKLQNENKVLMDEELQIMRTLQLNKEQLAAFVSLVGTENSERQTIMLLDAIGLKAKANLFRVVHRYLLEEKIQLPMIKNA